MLFGSCTALDPQTIFSSIWEHADDVLADRKANCKIFAGRKCASWVKDQKLAASAAASLAVAVARVPKPSTDFRRLDEDVRIQIGTGEFFARQAARRFAAIAIFQPTHDPKAGTGGGGAR